MMDEALEAEIRAHVSSQDGRLVVLAPEEASSVVEEIARRFIRDAAMTWWWDSLAKPGTAVQYGELDGLEHIRTVLSGKDRILLVVTDDDPPPWLVLTGSVSEVLHLLRESRWFEYFLTDESFEWVVFDTHHNQIVTAGTI